MSKWNETTDKVVAEALGLKDDGGKPRPDLIQPEFLEAIARIMAFGAEKYEENSWQGVEPKRYVAAALRHFYAYMRGEHIDSESGESHLAHCACNIMFLFHFETKHL